MAFRQASYFNVRLSHYNNPSKKTPFVFMRGGPFATPCRRVAHSLIREQALATSLRQRPIVLRMHISARFEQRLHGIGVAVPAFPHQQLIQLLLIRPIQLRHDEILLKSRVAQSLSYPKHSTRNIQKIISCERHPSNTLPPRRISHYRSRQL